MSLAWEPFAVFTPLQRIILALANHCLAATMESLAKPVASSKFRSDHLNRSSPPISSKASCRSYRPICSAVCFKTQSRDMITDRTALAHQGASSCGWMLPHAHHGRIPYGSSDSFVRHDRRCVHVRRGTPCRVWPRPRLSSHPRCASVDRWRRTVGNGRRLLSAILDAAENVSVDVMARMPPRVCAAGPTSLIAANGNFSHSPLSECKRLISEDMIFSRSPYTGARGRESSARRVEQNLGHPIVYLCAQFSQVA